jgi:DNA/RNA-binding domain of Phe-tRNA-synthetase-like protein
MYFEHAAGIWRDFPDLVPGVLYADGVSADSGTEPAVGKFTDIAQGRLSGSTESELPEIQAWRRAYARLGVKPTQYRCASEALLRRLRKEGSLPRLHPVVDLCNAISMAYAIPVAVLDVAHISGDLQVRYAAGDERYVTFGGEVEQPAAGEVIFADTGGYAHARRWTNRQSGRSSVRVATRSVLIVAEALHDDASKNVSELIDVMAAEFAAVGATMTGPAILTAQAPRFAW